MLATLPDPTSLAEAHARIRGIAERQSERSSWARLAVPRDVSDKGSVKDIIAAVGSAYGLTYEEIVGDRRSAHQVAARRAALHCVSKLRPRLTSQQIADHFRLDPSTVRRALRQMARSAMPKPLHAAAAQRSDTPDRRHVALVEEIDTLREEVRQLRRLLAPKLVAPKHWGLTRGEEMMLSALRSAGGQTLTFERALTALYERDADLAEPNIISVHVSRIRIKTARAGQPIKIEAVRSEGYRLTPEGLAALNAALRDTLPSPTPGPRASAMEG